MNGQMGFGDEPVEAACLITSAHDAHVWADGSCRCPGVTRTSPIYDPHTHVRTNDPGSSKRASKGKFTEKSVEALEIMGDYGWDSGLNDEEIGQHFAGPEGHQTYRRRGGDLRVNGWTRILYDEKGKAVTRATPIGGQGRVSVLTDYGREQYKLLKQIGKAEFLRRLKDQGDA